MKNTSITAFAIACLTIGCGGGDFTTATDTDTDTEFTEGTGGSESGGSGGEQIGETGGAGGTGAGGTGTGGNQVIDTGSGGDRGDGCIPKTCEEITFELTNEFDIENGTIGAACGAFDNGCDGVVTCGCDLDNTCGVPTPNFLDCNENKNCSTIVPTLPTQPNTCGGGCKVQNQYSGDLYCQGGDLVLCTGQFNTLELAELLTGKSCTPNVGEWSDGAKHCCN